MGENGPANMDGAPAANTPKAPTSVRVAQGLFLLNAVIWALLAVMALVRMAGGSASLGALLRSSPS